MNGLDGDRYFQVGDQLPPVEKEEIISFLKGNVDVFAWAACEASRIDLDFICHHLNVNLGVVPRRNPPPLPLDAHQRSMLRQ